ncbi:MAG: ketol-acid reductoisomerase [Clostridia bacterium]|jgi:ketol-acid reductoisomerase
MGKIYYDKDADLDYLKNKKIAIIGYGNQGRAQALNMRDSGVEDIIVGSIRDDSWEHARQDGFEVYSIEEASQKADILFMLIPDEYAPKVYEESIKPYLKEGVVLNFASGYNITFKLIKPPETADVIMVAPRMIGQGVREIYRSGKGFPAFIAIEQNASGKAKEIALAIAKAIGSTRTGVIEVSFRDETFLDLVAEQVTWPLILSVLTEVYKFELEMGHPEEAVLMELYLSKEPAVMMEKMAEVGLFKQLPMHSHTSQYGQLSRFQMVDKDYIRSILRERYEHIQSGAFAKEWKEEQEKGLPVFRQLLKEAFESDISKGEERIKGKLK